MTDSAELPGLRFILWDGEQGDYMDGVTCTAVSRVAGTCSGPIRPLSAGRHVISISAVGADGATSLRSASIEVTVGSSLTSVNRTEPADPAAPDPLGGASGATGAGGAANVTGRAGGTSVAPGVTVLAELATASPISDIAAAADGRVFVAARNGAVTQVTPAADATGRTVRGLAGLTDGESTASELLTLTLDPDFARSGHLYLGASDAAGFHLTRYRVDGERAVEATAVFDADVQDGDPRYRAAVVRFGPDGALYIALDNQADVNRAGDLGSFSGKVLRLNADGTVPADQAGLMPVYATDVEAPAGLAWPRTTTAGQHATMWIADEGNLSSSGGAPVASTLNVVIDDPVRAQARRGLLASRYSLPAGERPSAILAQGSDLIVGLAPSGELIRLQADAIRPQVASRTERLLEGYGPIHGLAATADGATVIVAVDGRLLALTPADLTK